jgi:UDP-glucose 4-epimerase
MNTDVLDGKTLLITGGTGSFGSAVLNRFLDTDIKEIRIFSRDEKKQEDMRIKYNSDKIKFCIGDVRSFESINSAMIGVDYVFCAAALKQVPSCEFYPIEAVKTNILGIENTLRAAVSNEVKKVIVLSTDKAVNPINAMGMSKALMEKVAVATARNSINSSTKICVTRYGNVMASRGSVIPLFVKQIKGNKALTITDPEMTRFMMSLSDAVELVLYAFNNCEQGDIFVQKSPASTIETLVQALKEIFKSKAPIKIMGTRHGEKKHEILLNREELFQSVDLGKYYKVPMDQRSLNYEKYFVKGSKPLSDEKVYSSENTQRLDVKEMKKLLLSLGHIKEQQQN